jgi:hypothetical protein
LLSSIPNIPNEIAINMNIGINESIITAIGLSENEGTNCPINTLILGKKHAKIIKSQNGE